MKKLNLLLIFVFAFQLVQAQYVFIPDTNFRKLLVYNYPSAMLGNNLDTTNPLIVSETSLDCGGLFISNLNGLQYFDNLQQLSCTHNTIKQLLKLPSGLQFLSCKVNWLDSLPSSLPPNLLHLNCSMNHLQKLPTLPSFIQHVDCSYNAIDTLYPYVNSITFFNCGGNQIQTLPIFNMGMLYFDCGINQISSILSLPAGLLTLNTSQNAIYSLPSLPNSLNTLICFSDSLSVLPSLPPNLIHLNCTANQLSVLPTLPNSLQHLDCQYNNLPVLPTLSNSLVLLKCDNNILPVLPSLPSGLIHLTCSYNNIPVLPFLPNALLYLDYSANPVSTLPVLSSNLNTLVWNAILTQSILPNLPSSPQNLYASNNILDSLPTLSSNLNLLVCRNDSLDFLPTLPASLLILDFGLNQLQTMPLLPANLKTLHFPNNQISVFNTLPNYIVQLDCGGNTQIACLPRIPRQMNYVRLGNTSIKCLPNFFQISDTLQTSYSVFAMSLCTPSGNCLCAWNIAGNVHANVSTNCLQDSLFPGNRGVNIKAKLVKNGTTLDQMIVTLNGEYSFDTGDNDTLDVELETAVTPIKVSCPPTLIHTVILSPLDSMKPNVNFGVECSGIEAGIKTIHSRFRPTFISHVNIDAGDLAQDFNVMCNSLNPAVVTTVLEGPITFLQSSANALSPTTVAGNVITYNVSNLSALNFKTAFDIDVLTNPDAVIGHEVCIITSISSVTNDIDLSNNILEVCLPVVSSFDPNAKYVSSKANSKPGDWLTYTIQFQNSGNDTAYNVVIRDTLSDNLDILSF
jgi:uncharacterized repeat protein (TIGR01451 family)